MWKASLKSFEWRVQNWEWGRGLIFFEFHFGPEFDLAFGAVVVEFGAGCAGFSIGEAGFLDDFFGAGELFVVAGGTDEDAVGFRVVHKGISGRDFARGSSFAPLAASEDRGAERREMGGPPGAGLGGLLGVGI